MSVEISPESSGMPVVVSESGNLLRRSHQVKVTLNPSELEFLDRIVVQMGSDRSSVFRHLLRMASDIEFSASSKKMAAEDATDITKLDSSFHGDEEKSPTAVIDLAEPRKFDEMPMCIHSLKEKKIVILNLTMMEPDQAQRAVDFVAGGSFALDGHQERVGESIFLFAPSCMSVGNIERLVADQKHKEKFKGRIQPPLLTGSYTKNSLNNDTPKNKSQNKPKGRTHGRQRSIKNVIWRKKAKRDN